MLLLSVGGTLEEEFTQIDLPLSPEVPKVFAAFPEWYIEDIADFLLFTIQVKMSKPILDVMKIFSYCKTMTFGFLFLFLILFFLTECASHR